MFVTLWGEPYLLWRAGDQHVCCGERAISTAPSLDILLQKRRDKAAAKRSFKRALASCPEVPRRTRR
jgi:putative transposase